MVIEIKYEKVDSTHMRVWTKDDVVLYKNDLQADRNDYNNALNRSDSEKNKTKERLSPGISIEEYNAYLQEKIDTLDILIELFNNETTDETIPFLNP